MKQIIQNLRSGETLLEDTPAPVVRKGTVLIQTTCSLVSLGTEKMLVDFGKAGLIAKARQQPDKVKQVLQKVKNDGLIPTVQAVFNKLDQPIALGYCNVGRVIAVGDGVQDFAIGDRVASNGPHAEVVCVPQNLVAHIPDNVTDEEAAFTVIGSIGLQGLRLLQPTLGETIVVTGLGLIGLITAQLLLANGCRVIGMDPDENRRTIAKEKGIIAIHPGQQDVVKTILALTGEIGADGVIITASAKNNEIISQAAQMSRKRGRIILVGVIGLDISRADFFEKELTFQVSCSYGPGRYDNEYEQRGHDYPLPYVRWTEKRNFEAILYAIASKKLQVDSLVTERVSLKDYQQVYGNMGHGSIATILMFDTPDPVQRPVTTVQVNGRIYGESKGVVGIIGAGNFTQMTLLPSMKGTGALLKYIVSASGVSGTATAKKYGFSHSTTDYQVVLKDPDVDLVMITTRHHQHAAMAAEALLAGKHVFVEKPLALNEEQLQQVIDASQASGKSLAVGFNRRFSPHIQRMKLLVGDEPGPLSLVMTMNAGAIPSNHWVHDLGVGGGRIIGEACHYFDLAVYLCNSLIHSVCMQALGAHPKENTDTVSILLTMKNGSTVVINYLSNGNNAYSKERIELYHRGRTLIMDDFRQTKAYGFKGFSGMKTKTDKGHANQFRLLVQSVQKGGKALFTFDEIVNVTRATFASIESMQTSQIILL